MPHLLAYLHSFGDHSAHSTASHFVYTALVLDQGRAAEAEAVWARLRSFYDAREPDPEQQLNLLHELQSLHFTVFSLVVDRRKLEHEGLKVREVFYKYFSKTFLRKITDGAVAFTIYAGKRGWPEFRRSLHSFIQEKVVQPDMFQQDRQFLLLDENRQEPLQQLAAFLSDCIGQIYCTSHASAQADQLYKQLHGHLFVDFFPSEKTDYYGQLTEQDQELNGYVARIALQQALRVLKVRKGAVSDEAKELLSYLLLMHRSAPDRLVKKHELLERLQLLFPQYTEQQLRQSIQSLRDAGALIASIQGKQGYKIPNKVEDIIGFYNRYLNSIVPMLHRIAICNRKLKTNSQNQVDLLGGEHNLQLLKELIKVAEQHRATRSTPEEAAI